MHIIPITEIVTSMLLVANNDSVGKMENVQEIVLQRVEIRSFS
jgi:hypothetical protein